MRGSCGTATRSCLFPAKTSGGPSTCSGSHPTRTAQKQRKPPSSPEPRLLPRYAPAAVLCSPSTCQGILPQRSSPAPPRVKIFSHTGPPSPSTCQGILAQRPSPAPCYPFPCRKGVPLGQVYFQRGITRDINVNVSMSMSLSMSMSM